MKFMSIISNYFNKGDTEDKKIKPAVVLLICGIAILLLSGLFTASDSAVEEKTEPEIKSIRNEEEKRLQKMLCRVDGVKNATVLISYKNNGISEALTEEKNVSRRNSDSIETQNEKKPVFDGDKNIVSKTQYMPEIKGVCIFYSGIESKITEDKLYRAVKGALGVELHKVEVIHTKD